MRPNLTPPEGYVPSTICGGFVGADVVGPLTLRVQLDEQLRQTGGHIGYVVVPDATVGWLRKSTGRPS